MSIKTKSYEAIPTHEFTFDRQEKGLFPNKGPFFGKRHWLILTLALLSETNQSVKVYMTVCIIAMTDPTANINKNIPTYTWENTGVILSAFLWGLCSSQMFAGWLMTKFKPKWPIVLAVITCSIMGFLIPTVAEYIGSVGVIICRVIQGFTMGLLGPFFHSLYGKWIPPCETSRLIAVVASGSQIGIITSMFLSGQLAASQYGWPLVMYFYSSLFLIWCLIFIYVGSNSPTEHSTISMEEKLYIQHSLSQVQKKNLIPPYRKMFTSLCVWANITCRIGAYFSYYTILSEISTYLKDILNIDLKSNGLFSALPYICTLCCIHLFGYLSDLLIIKSIFSKTTARKTMALMGCVVPTICIILLGYCESGQTLKIIILLSVMVSIDCTGFLHSTVINVLDLSPNHSGTTEGIINQISLITASGGPLLVQFFVSDKKSHAEWRVIFYTIAIVKILSVLMFLIWGSAETQSWNDEISENKTDLPGQKNQKREIYNTCW